jgi:3-dehydroquinate dehydratase II
MPLFSVIHGPNLNLLGTREPNIYGTESLDDINSALRRKADALEVEIEVFQSNHEGQLVDRIQSCASRVDGIIINAAAYSHTSVAIRDAISALEPQLPCVEVHLSIPGARETFRKNNVLEDIVSGRIEGFRGLSYLLALSALSTIVATRG